MTRDELEAVIWRNWPTRGTQSATAVDTILAAAHAYADSLRPEPGSHRPACPCHALYHSSDTDLHPLIEVLAEGLLGDADLPEWDGQPPYEVRSEYLDQFGGAA